MSEFSDIYYLFKGTQADGVKLLQRALKRGFVFTEQNNWVTILPHSIEMIPSKLLIRANTGKLLHLSYAEDFGWYFSIYEGSKRVCHFEYYWLEEAVYDQVDLDRSKVMELIDENDSLTVKASATDITRILYPNSMDDILESNPAYQFAEKLGLPQYSWLSYKYVKHDYDIYKEKYPGLKKVMGLV